MITPSRILALIAVLGVVGFGFWLERDLPDEKNRVRHPQAYSVCMPQGWSAEVKYNHGGEELGGTHAVDGLELTPDEFTGIRPTLLVDRLKDAPDPQLLQDEGWVAGTFQDQPAYVFEKVQPHGLVHADCFERAGTWFAVVERLSVAATAQKDEWWRFLETFRYPDGVPPAVATHSTAGAPAGATAGASAAAATAPSSTQPFKFPTIAQ